MVAGVTNDGKTLLHEGLAAGLCTQLKAVTAVSWKLWLIPLGFLQTLS